MLLGLDRNANEADVTDARRRLAKASHPDRGGDIATMQAINAAADHVLSLLRGGSTPFDAASARPRRRPQRPSWNSSSAVDHPSFTIEALPVDAFEALVIVASELGTLIDDDQPYRLEFTLDGDPRGWCEVTLVPDAGATTASVEVVAQPGFPRPSVEHVRDLLVAGLNDLDWDRLHLNDGPNLPPL